MDLRNFKISQISLALVVSLLALSGCADKKENTGTQASTPNDTANTANASTPNDSPALAETSTTSMATETNNAPVAIEEKNPSRFAALTDYIALKPSENWQW